MENKHIDKLLVKIVKSKVPLIEVVPTKKKYKKDAKKVEQILDWHMKNMIKDYYFYGK
jgi:predicted aldo/keto reductase-like oxidoreductase